MERLQKYLAAAGVASRRHCETLITARRVTVNGRVVDELGTKVDPETDIVALDGRRVRPSTAMQYLLLHKPQGYVTTAKDPFGRPTVIDLLPGVKERVYPVGRLDYETEGLLLLTNDGDLAYALTHPKHRIIKSYQATIAGAPDETSLQQLRQGVQLEDGPTAPAEVKLLEQGIDRAVLNIKIHEGRNRQVRRMLAAVGHTVLSLRRVGLGFLTLGNLPVGKYRRLNEKEVKRLQALVACSPGQEKI
jgi:23S rRNA pseudouridine2605 synthase